MKKMRQTVAYLSCISLFMLGCINANTTVNITGNSNDLDQKTIELKEENVDET